MKKYKVSIHLDDFTFGGKDSGPQLSTFGLNDNGIPSTTSNIPAAEDAL